MNVSGRTRKNPCRNCGGPMNWNANCPALCPECKPIIALRMMKIEVSVAKLESEKAELLSMLTEKEWPPVPKYNHGP